MSIFNENIQLFVEAAIAEHQLPGINVETYLLGIPASNLSEFQKQVLWAGIKALDKQLAQLITNKPKLNGKCKTDGIIFIKQVDFKRFINAGMMRCTL